MAKLEASVRNLWSKGRRGMRLKHDSSAIGGNPSDRNLGSAVRFVADLCSDEQGLGQIPKRDEGLGSVELVSLSHAGFESRLHGARMRAALLGDTERARQLGLRRQLLQGGEVPRGKSEPQAVST